MKCESCPNRPRDPKKAACDNCIQREKKSELVGVLSLSFDSLLKKPAKEEPDGRYADKEYEMARYDEETIAAMKREEARKLRDREIREENRKDWWK